MQISLSFIVRHNTKARAQRAPSAHLVCQARPSINVYIYYLNGRERAVESVSDSRNKGVFNCTPAPRASHRARARRAPIHQCHYIPLAGRTCLWPYNRRAPHTRRAVGVHRTTPSARLTLGARPSINVQKARKKKIGRLERKREGKRLVESASGSRNKSVCIASQAPGTRLTQHRDARPARVHPSINFQKPSKEK